jgi:hypothetical protein
MKWSTACFWRVTYWIWSFILSKRDILFRTTFFMKFSIKRRQQKKTINFLS